MSNFSLRLSIEYIIFNEGYENIKSAKEGARLEMDSPPAPKKLQPNFGIKLSILFTYNHFLLSC